MQRFNWRNMIVLLCLCLTITGCVYQKKFESKPNDYGSRSISGPDASGKSGPTAMQASALTDHHNGLIQYSQQLSDLVSDMAGIRDSFVVVSDKNAYVAIILDGTATGSKGKGIEIPSDNTITSNQYHFVPRTHETVPPGTIMYNKYSFDTIPNHDDISSELKQQLTSKITEGNPQIQGVFISANRNFINIMSQYAHQAWRGESLQNELQPFNTLMQQVFGEKTLIYPPNRPTT